MQFSCSDCSQPMKCADNLAGKKTACPKCGHVVTIPPLAPVALTATPRPTTIPARLAAIPLPIRIGGVIAAAAVLMLLCSCVVWVGISVWPRSGAVGKEGPVVAVKDVAEKKESPVAPKMIPDSKEDEEPLPDQLTVIYRHTRNLSQGKVVIAANPVPSGWVGGDGWRRVGIQQSRWESNLSAILAGGKVGDTAEIRR